MECSICDLRGAVQACSECHAQLCEVCSTNCRQCGKPLCPAHTYKSHSGKLFCESCLEERKAKKERMKAMADGQRFEEEDMFEDAQAQARPGAYENVVEDEALTASANKTMPPWKLSVYSASLALVAVLFLLVLPTLRQVPLPGGSTVPTPYILMIIPFAAVLWAGIGLVNEEYTEERSKALGGLGLAILAVVLMIVAVVTDPARKAARDAANAQMIRTNMTPQELENWRKETLERYRR